MQRLPLSVHNAYSDLLDRLQDGAVLEIGGRPVQRTIRGRKYWYARSYVGNEEKEKYLGPDGPALRERSSACNSTGAIGASARKAVARWSKRSE